MKKHPFIRFILTGILNGFMYLMGILLFPVYYPLRRYAMKHRRGFLWWWFNDDEENDFNNLYGDAIFRLEYNYPLDMGWARKLVAGFHWLAIRNSHWVFRKKYLAPKQGPMEDIDVRINDTIPKTDGLYLLPFGYLGTQYAFYTIGGYRYFRYSFVREVKLLWIWPRVWQFQLGWNETRPVYKSRFRNYKNV